MDETASGLIHLGGDVWLARTRPPEEVQIRGRPHYRFMDRLLIPAHTSELGFPSILAINRWRERLLHDSELPHRTLVRRVVSAAVSAIGSGNMIEIGCGKFPLQAELAIDGYLGIDVDPEAVEQGTRQGLHMVRDPSEALARAPETRVLTALFALQFPLAASTGELLRTLHGQCVIIANLPTKDDRLIEERTHLLSEAGFEVQTIDFTDAHDRLLLASRKEALPRRASTADEVRRQLAEP